MDYPTEYLNPYEDKCALLCVEANVVHHTILAN